MKRSIQVFLAALIALSMLCTAACGDGIVPISLIAVPIEEQHTTESGVLLMESSVDAVEFTGGGDGAAAAMTRIYADIFSSRAQQYIDEEIAYSADFYSSDGDAGSHSSYTQKAGVFRSDDRLFALSVTTESYSMGAAHGIAVREAVCFNPVDGKQLSLSDLTADGSDPTDKLAGLLAEKYTISEYAEGYGYDEEEAAEVIKIMLGDGIYQWFITDGFVLICNPYDLAPHAMGGFELKLTPEELNGVLESKWFAEK